MEVVVLVVLRAIKLLIGFVCLCLSLLLMRSGGGEEDTLLMYTPLLYIGVLICECQGQTTNAQVK